MNIVEMRLKTAQAIAKANGDTNSVAVFDQLITDLQAVKHDPYILPDVIVPPAAPVDPQAAHDAAMAAGSAPEQVTPPPSDVAGADAVPPSAAPVSDGSSATPVSADGQVAVAPSVTSDPISSAPAADASAPASSVPDAAPVAPAASDAPAEPAAPDAAPAPAPVADAPANPPQAAPDDVDPTPPESQTIDTLDARLDALEGHPRKVSRQ